jgi:hypothetical protein
MRIFTLIIIFMLQSQAETPAKVKLDDQLQRQRMLEMTRQLGVTCITCHNSSNFSSSEKATFKKAKEHIFITQVLIDHGMDGKNNRPKADCYLCHRGKLTPDYREPFDPLIQDKTKKELPKTEPDVVD